MVKLAIATIKTGWGKKKQDKTLHHAYQGLSCVGVHTGNHPSLGRAAPPRASRRQVCPVPLPSAGRIRSVPPPCPSALTPPLGFRWSLPPGPGVTRPRVLPSNTAVQFYLRNVNCTPVPRRAPHLQRDRAGLCAWCTQGLLPGAQRIDASAPVINVTRGTLKVRASPFEHQGEEVLCSPRHGLLVNGTRHALHRSYKI